MNKQHLASISYMRIIATICVIWLHICSTLTDNLNLFVLSNNQIKFYSASYQTMYWAVPLFFMITGALLLNPEKKISIQDIVKRFQLRILLALIVFGIPFALIKLIMADCPKTKNQAVRTTKYSNK